MKVLKNLGTNHSSSSGKLVRMKSSDGKFSGVDAGSSKVACLTRRDLGVKNPLVPSGVLNLYEGP